MKEEGGGVNFRGVWVNWKRGDDNVVLCGVDRFKLYSYFRGSGKVKVFLVEEIKVIVF